jgi:predicted ATPase
MLFRIRNFGKIAEANIQLDGITVICGDNNTGKSTVGKALFSFYNSLNDYKNKIDAEKAEKLTLAIRNYAVHSRVSSINMFSGLGNIRFVSEHSGQFTVDEVNDFIETTYSVSLSKEKIDSLVKYLNTPEIDVLNEYVFRYISGVMNGQVRNVLSTKSSQCFIAAKIKDFENTIKIKKQCCNCELDESIEHSAYYINTPFSLDSLNDTRMALFGSGVMNRSVIEAIHEAQVKINNNSMTNILDTVLNKKELEKVREIIKKAYRGKTIIDNGRYYYTENGVSYDFRNISAGLKSFALIERLLETGALKRKDVLILDEPEIHLHSEWMIIYAELIVMLQKAFDLTILIVTHSFHFLESLIYYMGKYNIEKKGRYYIPVQSEKGIVIKDGEENLVKIKKSLKSGMYSLADMRLAEVLGDEDDEDNN